MDTMPHEVANLLDVQGKVKTGGTGSMELEARVISLYAAHVLTPGLEHACYFYRGKTTAAEPEKNAFLQTANR